MSFGFRKLYADLVAADGTVCVAYTSWMDVLGISLPYAGLEHYSARGGREVVRAKKAWFEPPVHDPSDPLVLRLDLSDGVFELRYTGQCVSYEPTTPVHPAGMEWMVCVPYAACEGRWIGRPDRPTLRGTGYADWVELRRLTRSFAMQRLQWGRLHLSGESLVFNVVQFRSGTTWRRLVRVPANERASTTQAFDTSWENGYLTVRRAEEGSSGGAAEYQLRPQRVLHKGPAIDRERFPGRIERRVFNAITGPNSETRWLSRVHRCDAPDVTGWAVHEEVEFSSIKEASSVTQSTTARPATQTNKEEW